MSAVDKKSVAKMKVGDYQNILLSVTNRYGKKGSVINLSERRKLAAVANEIKKKSTEESTRSIVP